MTAVLQSLFLIALFFFAGCGKQYEITVKNQSQHYLKCTIRPGTDNAEKEEFNLEKSESNSIEYSYSTFQAGEGDYELRALYWDYDQWYQKEMWIEYYHATKRLSNDYTWIIQ